MFSQVKVSVKMQEIAIGGRWQEPKTEKMEHAPVSPIRAICDNRNLN